MVDRGPDGVAFALGIDRWRGRAAAGANFVMLLSFVMPEIILGLALFFVFSFLLEVRPPRNAQRRSLGLDRRFQLSYPVIIVRARLLSIGKDYEEAAMDLGATPRQSIRARAPSDALPGDLRRAPRSCSPTRSTTSSRCDTSSGPSTSEPLSVKIYSFGAQPNRRLRSTRRRRSCWVPRSWSGSSRTCSTARFTRGQRTGGGLGDLATQF